MSFYFLFWKFYKIRSFHLLLFEFLSSYFSPSTLCLEKCQKKQTETHFVAWVWALEGLVSRHFQKSENILHIGQYSQICHVLPAIYIGIHLIQYLSEMYGKYCHLFEGDISQESVAFSMGNSIKCGIGRWPFSVPPRNLWEIVENSNVYLREIFPKRTAISIGISWKCGLWRFSTNHGIIMWAIQCWTLFCFLFSVFF